MKRYGLNKKTYMILMMIFSIVMIFKYWGNGINIMNSTMFAFSYKYGFISRGVVGTAYALLGHILPFDIMDYSWLVRICFFLTICFFAFIFLFIFLSFKRINKSMNYNIMVIAYVLICFTVPMFVGEYNFGRTDMFMAFLSIVSVMLIINKKAEWLVILFSALGVMVHQGYVFMFLNVVLVALLYRIITKSGKERGKYIAIFVITLVVASVLFLYFELFSHIDGESVYDTIANNAKLLSKEGKYHADVIDKELLGIDLSSRETVWKKINLIQVPIFVLLMAPYIIIVFKVFRGLFKRSNTKVDIWKYLIALCGIGTMLPDLLLKVDYGRWVYTIVFYYCVVLIFMLTEKDSKLEETLRCDLKYMNKINIISIFVLAYPIVLQPLGDVYICSVTENIVNFINNYILHWWTYDDTHGSTERACIEIVSRA